MRTSEQINEIATALAKAQSEMEGAVKDSSNPFFKSKYADLASVWDACRVPLTKNGLSVAQFPTTSYNGEPEVYTYTSKSGETRTGVKVVCIVSVVTRLLHTSGQFLEDTSSAMLATGDPQAVGSAITYLRRYSLQSIAGVAPEDDDGNAASAKHTPVVETTAPKPDPSKPIPKGAVLLRKTEQFKTDAGKDYWLLILSTGEEVISWKRPQAEFSEQACQNGWPVLIRTQAGQWNGKWVASDVHRAEQPTRELTAADIFNKEVPAAERPL